MSKVRRNGQQKFSYLSPDAEVQGSSLPRRVVSIDKELYSTLSLFTQLYKWVLVTYCWGVNMRRTSIPSRRGLAILLSMLHAIKGNRDKLRPFGPLARVRLWLVRAFTFTILITMNTSRSTQIIINKQDLFKTYNLRI